MYKSNDNNCHFFESYPNDVCGIKKAKITTALPDKKTFKIDKKCPKHPKNVF